MIEQMYTKHEAFELILGRDDYNEKREFSIGFFKANRSKKKAGEYVEFKRAVGCGLPAHLNARENELVGIRPVGVKNPKDVAVHAALIYHMNGVRVAQ